LTLQLRGCIDLLVPLRLRTFVLMIDFVLELIVN